MNQPTIINVLFNELLPRMKKAGEADSVLLKYAQDHNLSPAQLERMAQVFNGSKTLTFLEKSADRGQSFPLVDPPALVKAYVEALGETKPMQKAASAPKQAFDPYRFPGQTDVISHTPKLDALLAEREQRVKAAWVAVEEEGPDVERQRRIQLEEARAALIKNAQALRDRLLVVPKMHDAAQDIGALLGKEAAAKVLEQAFKSTGHAVPALDDAEIEKRAFDKDLRYNSERALTLIAAVDLLDSMAAYTKVAAGTQAPPKQKPQKKNGPRGTHAPVPPPSGYSVQEELDHLNAIRQPWHVRLQDGEFADSLVGDLPGELKGFTEQAGKAHYANVMRGPVGIMSHLKGLLGDPKLVEPGINPLQKKVDSATSDVERLTTVYRLMQADPIISEADPEMVLDIFNTLSEIYPDLTRDRARLRMALREAVQYEALPQHTQKELAETRKSIADARAKEQGGGRE